METFSKLKKYKMKMTKVLSSMKTTQTITPMLKVNGIYLKQLHLYLNSKSLEKHKFRNKVINLKFLKQH